MRLALLLQLCVAVGATFLVEQPRGSLLFQHERLEALLQEWFGTISAPMLLYL